MQPGSHANEDNGDAARCEQRRKFWSRLRQRRIERTDGAGTGVGEVEVHCSAAGLHVSSPTNPVSETAGLPSPPSSVAHDEVQAKAQAWHARNGVEMSPEKKMVEIPSERRECAKSVNSQKKKMKTDRPPTRRKDLAVLNVVDSGAGCEARVDCQIRQPSELVPPGYVLQTGRTAKGFGGDSVCPEDVMCHHQEATRPFDSDKDICHGKSIRMGGMGVAREGEAIVDGEALTKKMDDSDGQTMKRLVDRAKRVDVSRAVSSRAAPQNLRSESRQRPAASEYEASIATRRDKSSIEPRVGSAAGRESVKVAAEAGSSGVPARTTAPGTAAGRSEMSEVRSVAVSTQRVERPEKARMAIRAVELPTTEGVKGEEVDKSQQEERGLVTVNGHAEKAVVGAVDRAVARAAGAVRRFADGSVAAEASIGRAGAKSTTSPWTEGMPSKDSHRNGSSCESARGTKQPSSKVVEMKASIQAARRMAEEKAAKTQMEIAMPSNSTGITIAGGRHADDRIFDASTESAAVDKTSNVETVADAVDRLPQSCFVDKIGEKVCRTGTEANAERDKRKTVSSKRSKPTGPEAEKAPDGGVGAAAQAGQALGKTVTEPDKTEPLSEPVMQDTSTPSSDVAATVRSTKPPNGGQPPSSSSVTIAGSRSPARQRSPSLEPRPTTRPAIATSKAAEIKASIQAARKKAEDKVARMAAAKATVESAIARRLANSATSNVRHINGQAADGNTSRANVDKKASADVEMGDMDKLPQPLVVGPIAEDMSRTGVDVSAEWRRQKNVSAECPERTGQEAEAAPDCETGAAAQAASKASRQTVVETDKKPSLVPLVQDSSIPSNDVAALVRSTHSTAGGQPSLSPSASTAGTRTTSGQRTPSPALRPATGPVPATTTTQARASPSPSPNRPLSGSAAPQTAGAGKAEAEIAGVYAGALRPTSVGGSKRAKALNVGSRVQDVEHRSDEAIEQWKIRRLIKTMESYRGASCTSMISIVIPAKDDIGSVQRLLSDEIHEASCIKQHSNRIWVTAAITAALQRLRLYKRTPSNGLILYSGVVLTEDGKDKKVTFDLEPFRPINNKMYLSGNHFFTNDLKNLLQTEAIFGFIVFDGNGCLYGTLQGNSRQVLHKFNVDLPKKHGRGGQSALRFARLRLEKRHNYVRRVGELAKQLLITNDKVNVAGIVIAGSTDFKSELLRGDVLDPRIEAVIIRPLFDIQYGGETGFHEAIGLAASALQNVKFVQEKRLIRGLFEEMAQNTGKYCYGIEDTIQGLDMGAVETLVIWEDLPLKRVHIRNPHTAEEQIAYVKPEDEMDDRLFRCPDTGVELDLVENVPFVDWIVEHYMRFGAKLEFITDKSQEGHQFCRGFGGIGGLLRYRVDFEVYEEFDCEDSDVDFY